MAETKDHDREREEDIVKLRAALRDVVDRHCPNQKLFCGGCTPARKLLDDVKGRQLQRNYGG